MLNETKILITGGTGRLGKAFKKILPNAIYPNRNDMDITNIEMIENFIKNKKPEIIIHLAALASIPKCEENKTLAWNTNVIATRNIVKLSKKYGVKKFIYLQSACIFSGEDDFMYDEDSIPSPKHYYGMTKLIAEEIIKSYNDENFQTIIARTNFTTMPWEYPKAFTDRFGTYLFAQGVAKGIKEIIETNTKLPIIHICGDREISMYEYAKLGGSDVEKITLEEYSGIGLTRKMSLTTKYWHTYKIEESDFNDN
ncbi:MAG: sugar nucleotide-binding protein [Candidatus Gracilibacteria bacterium]|nr:sugar nucleotide-binding protein [Candidatus Gracilibacteria bacterium]